jgi:galactokinase
MYKIAYLRDNLLLVIIGWKDIQRLLAKPESRLPCGGISMKAKRIGITEPSNIDSRVQSLLAPTAYYAPGRVNLIGEHTDYNGGYVLPAAIDYGTIALAARRDDGTVRLVSTSRQVRVALHIDDIRPDPANDWANYPLGVVYKLRKAGIEIGGVDILIDGDIPGGGLSSSASLELATAVALLGVWDQTMDRVDLVKLCQRVENEFVGVNSGIMDQYAVGMGREGHAIFLDCRAIQHRYVPLRLPGFKIVISNTKKPRGLVDSKYNERRSQCEEGLRMLKSVLPNIECLADVSIDEFEAHSAVIDDPIIRNRVEHIVYENARVLSAVTALEAGDLDEFGRLMVESHNSLRDLYEVTGIELDSLVEEALKIEGVVGSRMTGAGFGGCTVSIVEQGQIEEFARRVAEGYTRTTGLTPEFYVTGAADGARRIS